MFKTLAKLQAATLAARARTGDATIGTEVSGGLVRVVRVTYSAAGKSTVTPLTAPMSADAACAALDELKPAVMFSFDGKPFTLADMLAANSDDAELCEWLRVAQVGDTFPAFVWCTRIA